MKKANLLEDLEPGTRVSHESWGLGTVVERPKGLRPDFTSVRFDVLPPCHWAFEHLRNTSVSTSDLLVV